ncbi:hypothetical protein [Shimia sagamensis]|uniref:Uncharacterized protein n=1 Tax=Shimia sagamensis TaxID=1566352 RepID=A0ABY1PM65_9RHOB|nr:hypothetical protein [Shimia sagamensis]SMP37176.1 hypothetical protein SAMN06265373_1273 [Shimia sagamensis]
MGNSMQIPLNGPECECLGLFRMAISEETDEERLRAIQVIRHEVVSLGLENFPIGKSSSNEFTRWIAETARERYDAAHEFGEIAQRYEGKNERHLNIAEYIGKRVWDSIQNEKFQGLHTPSGILEQTSDYARKMGIRGARDQSVLREIWGKHRGVVHLGMAMDFCEDHPGTTWHVLQLAETFRAGLSSNYPQNAPSPYVDPDVQLSFFYLSGP